MGLSLTDIPHDLLLEITAHLELGEVFSFVSTCNTLRKLYYSRALWISTLSRTRQDRRLACPRYLSLAHASLKTLQCIASHTYRLKQNLNSSDPKLKRAVKAKFVSSEEMSVVAIVPGTGILCLYMEHSGMLTVVSLDAVDGLNEENLEMELRGTLTMECFEAYEGKYVLALVTASNLEGRKLHVISLSYLAGTPTSLESIFTLQLSFSPRTMVMYEGFLGIIADIKNEESMDLQVHMVDCNTETVKEMRLDIGHSVPDIAQISSKVFDDRIFIMESTTTCHRLYSFQASSLFTRFSSCPSRITCTEEVNLETFDDDGLGRDVLVGWNRQGLILTELLEPTSYEEQTMVQVSFYPNEAGYHCTSSMPSSPASSTISLESTDSFVSARSTLSTQSPSIPSCLYDGTSPLHRPYVSLLSTPTIHNLPGYIATKIPDNIESFWLAASGEAYGFILLDTRGNMPAEVGDDEIISLHLLRYSRASRSCIHKGSDIDSWNKGEKRSGVIGEVTSTKLSVPAFIKLENIYSIRMDEGYGVIYMIDRDGWIWSLSYA